MLTSWQGTKQTILVGGGDGEWAGNSLPEMSACVARGFIPLVLLLLLRW